MAVVAVVQPLGHRHQVPVWDRVITVPLCPFERGNRVEDRHCGGVNFFLPVNCGLRIEQRLCRGNSSLDTGEVLVIRGCILRHHADGHLQHLSIRILYLLTRQPPQGSGGFFN